MNDFLNRRRWVAGVAVLALLSVFSAPAFANGNSSKSQVNVRVKNFRASPVAVAVANKNPTNFRGLNSLQTTQFKVNKGTFVVSEQAVGTSKVKARAASATFNTGNRKTVYIALTDAGIEDTTTRF